MSLSLRSNKFSKIPQLKLPAISIQDVHEASVDTVGMIDSCVLYPTDILRIGQETEGDLLLVKATHPTKKLLYPGVYCARRYGVFVILNTPNQPTIDIEQWEIIGAVKGVERSLDHAAFGVDRWWIKIFGLERYMSSEWLTYIENTPLPPEYLAELAQELQAFNGVSIQASWTKEGLEALEVPPSNTIVFSMHKLETSSGFVSSWAAASKRQIRRKRQRRRQSVSSFGLLPVPECRRFMIHQQALDTSRQLFTSFPLACK